MAQRDKTATVDLKVRMKEPLRAQIEQAAQERGVSLNAEAEARLENSFRDEERFGGRATFNVVVTVLAAFLRGGKAAARSDGHDDWTTERWMSDPHCYEAAVMAVVEDLWKAHPMPDTPWAGIDKWFESLKGRLFTHAFRDAERLRRLSGETQS